MELKTFKHVDYLWDEARASELRGDEVALFLYRSNILGTDLRITNYGGGNTSCRTTEKDPLTGEQKEIMWIKGSRESRFLKTRWRGRTLRRSIACAEEYLPLEFRG